MAHVEHTASGLAHHGESFYQDFVQNFLQGFVLLFFELLGAVGIGFSFGFGIGFRRRRRGDMTQPLLIQAILDALPELVRFGAQFRVGELLHLRFEGIDSLDPGH